MNSPGPSAADIQSHLYASFLQGRTADVALHVKGSWSAIYRLHRVVLIQSGFFRSLFTAGFVESSPKLGSHYAGPDELDIIFDDPNISRAAFELCIARLYGGGPPLFLSPSLVSSMEHPLTPSFPVPQEDPKTPPGHHPATPRFLLSLLATSIYLSIPFLASQALSSILSTVGPRTVLQYMNFALGESISPPDQSIGEPEAAVGLENVAQIFDEEEEVLVVPVQTTKGKERETIEVEGLDATEESPSKSTSLSEFTDESSVFSDDDIDEKPKASPSFHYGAVSDKIGEAVACWLTRWAVDILVHEQGTSKVKDVAAISRKRSVTFPLEISAIHDSPTKDTTSLPVIWARGGLTAKWVSALVSADTLFVKGERERYEFARSVVELRRKDGIIEAEEAEWAKMFENGIYYANMTMEDVLAISQDISPVTKRPFVPLSVLQAASWSHSVLRHQITFRPSSTSSVTNFSISAAPPSPSSPPPREKELGIIQTTADIHTQLSALDQADGRTTFVEESKPYFPVPADSTLRIGDNGSSISAGDGVPMTMDQLFSLCHSPSLSTSPSSPSNANATKSTTGSRARLPTSEASFFGILPARHTASTCVTSDSKCQSRWSPYPPYRFAVEFWDLDSLKEKSKLHSHTIWYAGSLFNVYVQVVRKKAPKSQVQLGIYLQRQSNIDPIPPSSAPSAPITRERGISISGQSSSSASRSRGPPSSFSPSTSPTAHYSPSIHPPTRSITPYSHAHSSAYSTASLATSAPSVTMHNPGSHTVPATSLAVAPSQPYRDPRPSISAYFAISCASATGSSQTRFTSAPDAFPVSHSWGWKSSSLRTEEYIDIDAEDPDGRSFKPSKGISFRATVTIGLV